MKIDARNDNGIRSLLPDVSRLAILSEQLLDLHRLDNGAPSDRIDLAVLARSVAGDLALGIPAEEHERVLEPFHRLRPHLSGAGLGLSLVKQVVDHHRGRITIATAPSGGAIYRWNLSRFSSATEPKLTQCCPAHLTR